MCNGSRYKAGGYIVEAPQGLSTHPGTFNSGQRGRAAEQGALLGDGGVRGDGEWQIRGWLGGAQGFVYS